MCCATVSGNSCVSIYTDTDWYDEVFYHEIQL